MQSNKELSKINGIEHMTDAVLPARFSKTNRTANENMNFPKKIPIKRNSSIVFDTCILLNVYSFDHHRNTINFFFNEQRTFKNN